MQKVAIATLCILLLIVNATGCSLDREDEEPVSFIGKWKLEFISGPNETIEYSRYNIVYEFKTHNVLMVSGKVDNTDLSIHKKGKHFYEVIPPDFIDPLMLVFYKFIRIDTVPYNLSYDHDHTGDVLGMRISYYADDDTSPSYVIGFSKYSY